MLLAGDIGGTKSNLAVFSVEKCSIVPLTEMTYRSTDYPNLETIISEYLSQFDFKVTQASLGVAGPVVEDQASITNLSWSMTADALRDTFDLTRVHLLNDLVAMAAAVPRLEDKDLHTLNPGKPVHGGTIAVIAPGTGLGEAYLTWDGSRYFPYASEGGHSDFAPTNQLALKLHQYLLDRFGHVSCERVCSGNGIPNIYAFLRDEKYAEEPDWLAEQLAKAKDPTPIIAKAALDKKRSCKLCSLTMDTFVSILGAESGNMALKVLSSGGVYLGGGIPPRILPYLDSGIFMQAFLHKGRLASVLSQMPVHVILNRKAALLGAAYYGLDRWQD